jgi:hypothetical protein
MPIKKFISGATFGPETIKDMTTAFERIRKILRLEDPDDPLVEVVAKKVISLASQGTFDPKEIERLVIADTKRLPRFASIKQLNSHLQTRGRRDGEKRRPPPPRSNTGERQSR